MAAWVSNRNIQNRLAEKKGPKKKWHIIFPILDIGLGVALATMEYRQGLSTAANYKYCSVYEKDFSSGTLDSKIWANEVISEEAKWRSRLLAKLNENTTSNIHRLR
jgi:hypothetical protein